MKLLFDQNLPHRFVKTFADLFPGSVHVKDVGLTTATDRQIWDFARNDGFAIVSKDGDFHHLSFLFGAPPKTIWLRCGNCSVLELEMVIRSNFEEIRSYLNDPAGALLIVGGDHRKSQ